MKLSLKVMSACFVAAMASQADAVTIHSQDFNANDGGYTVTNVGVVEDPWTYSGAGPNGSWFTNGTQNQNAPTSSALTSPNINVTSAGPLTLSFLHRYNFEFDSVGNRWDGGAVFVSVNNGPFNQVPAGSFTTNGYDGVIAGNNALNGLSAFNSVSGFPGAETPLPANNGIFITSVATLGTFNLGDTIALRFLGAWDEFVEGNLPNWEITSLQLDTAASIPEPATALFGVLGLAALAHRRRTVTG